MPLQGQKFKQAGIFYITSTSFRGPHLPKRELKNHNSNKAKHLTGKSEANEFHNIHSSAKIHLAPTSGNKSTGTSSHCNMALPQGDWTKNVDDVHYNQKKPSALLVAVTKVSHVSTKRNRKKVSHQCLPLEWISEMSSHVQ